WIAFDNPFRLGYQYVVSFNEQQNQGLGGVLLPRPSVYLELLSAPRGLLRLSPWLGLAPLGLVALRRPAARREALLAAAIVAAFLTYNSGYHLPFGGATPGPRFLLPALPFAAVIVALAPRMFQ